MTKITKVNPWIEHVKKYKKTNPHLTYKQVLMKAKKTYRNIHKTS